MSNYSLRARETLSWVAAILQECSTLKEYEAARKDVEDMVMQLISGTAASFEKRTNSTEEL